MSVSLPLSAALRFESVSHDRSEFQIDPLNRDVAEQTLDLIQFAAGEMVEAGACRMPHPKPNDGREPTRSGRVSSATH
jgi:hypothetical protein